MSFSASHLEMGRSKVRLCDTIHFMESYSKSWNFVSMFLCEPCYNSTVSDVGCGFQSLVSSGSC